MTSRLEQPGGERKGAQSLSPVTNRVHAMAGERIAAHHRQRPVAVIVAGMHRSGTSALTRALSVCGLQLPRTLIPGNAFNEDGYWESMPINLCNNGLLREVDSAWDDALGSRTSRKGRYPRRGTESIKSVVRDQFEPDRDIVIKDPRISIMFDAWREALAELDYDPVVLIPMRHPLEVAASLSRRDGFPPLKSVLLWLGHLLALERDSRGVPRAFIAYDDLLTDWRACFRRIERVTGLRLPNWTDASEIQVDRFLSGDRRHYRYEAALLDTRADLPAWIARAYRWAIEAATADEEPALAPLNEIAAEFHRAGDIFAPLLAFERHRAERAKALGTHGQAATEATTEQLRVTLYSATANAPFDEETCERQVVALTREARTFAISTAVQNEPLTGLRIDPADSAGRLLLHGLRVLAPDGAPIWQFSGQLDLFSLSDGIAAEPLGGDAVLLEFLHDDPRIMLPVPDFGVHRQATVEIIASAPNAAELALLRTRSIGAQVAASEQSLRTEFARQRDHAGALAAQQIETMRPMASRLDQVERRQADIARTLDRLAAAQATAVAQAAAAAQGAAAAEAAAEARALQLSAFLDRRMAMLSEEFASRALSSAQAYEAELRIISQQVLQTTQERDRALAAAETHRQEVAALRASSSWRVTAPMRVISRGPTATVRALKQAARAVRAGIRRRLNPATYANPALAAQLDEGSARLLARSSLFDPDWYLATYPDLRLAGVDPLLHYLHQGGFEGRSPGPAFDSAWYLAQNPDVAAVGMNPLVHYLVAGRREQRAPLPGQGETPRPLGEHVRLLRGARHWKHLIARAGLAVDPLLPRRLARRLQRTALLNAPRGNEEAAEPAAHTAAFDQLFATAKARGSEYVSLAPNPIAVTPRIRAIAFYLPQFHPIPENDAWWGKGFTEWTNVSKATPQFVGHYQPRLPDELGFYDLRLPEVQRRQVELAKHYGIHGFCFHYYWFTGRKRLLERPLNQFLAASDIDFPFCICWANENWTRRWDGLEHDILMEQRHEPHDDLEFIEDLAPVLHDPRYIKIDGRPLIIVYRVDILPRPLQTVQVWRDYCRANGLGDPYLVAAQTFGTTDPRPYGFDAAVQFPPHSDYSPEEITRELTMLNPRHEKRVYSYERVARREASAPFPDYTLFKGVIPGWDNEARKPGKGHTFAGATPALFRAWLTAHCQATDQRYRNPDEKLVFINAWNEWAEGAYLEPDRRFGYAFLQAARSVVSAFPDEACARTGPALEGPPLYVAVHAFYDDVFAEILDYLRALERPFTLCASCPPERAEAIRAAFAKSGLACPFYLVEVENRGRDVHAFFEMLRTVPMPEDAVILKVHTKKSTHREDGVAWRREMLDQLLAPRVVERALGAFADDARLGLVAPGKHLAPITTYIGFNQERIEALLKRGGWAGIDMNCDVFAAGTMFFIRRARLEPLLALGLTREDFEPEAGQNDGTLAHALERMFALVVLRQGGRIADTDTLLGVNGGGSADDFAFAVKTDYLYRESGKS